MTAALGGTRVVELGWAAAGPLVGTYLAQHGADVIHVESSTALDPFRSTYPPFRDNVVGPDRAGMFAFYNAGKRGVTLDLKQPRAVELARHRRTGEGCVIDLSQYEAGLQFLAPVLLEHAANGTVPTRDANHDRVAVPHGVYPARGDDRWMALSVWSDDEWSRFRLALGDPEWSRGVGLATT